jgi:hypothetical protein
MSINFFISLAMFQKKFSNGEVACDWVNRILDLGFWISDRRDGVFSFCSVGFDIYLSSFKERGESGERKACAIPHIWFSFLFFLLL